MTVDDAVAVARDMITATVTGNIMSPLESAADDIMSNYIEEVTAGETDEATISALTLLLIRATALIAHTIITDNDAATA